MENTPNGGEKALKLGISGFIVDQLEKKFYILSSYLIDRLIKPKNHLTLLSL
jgi:hypothetical protein